jgi:hypothetical protein
MNKSNALISSERRQTPAKDDVDDVFTTCCNCNMIMPISTVNQHSSHCTESIDSHITSLGTKNAQLNKLNELFKTRLNNNANHTWGELAYVSEKAISALDCHQLKSLINRLTVTI